MTANQQTLPSIIHCLWQKLPSGLLHSIHYTFVYQYVFMWRNHHSPKLFSVGVGVVAEWLGRLLISSDHSLINPLIRGRPGSIPALTLELRLEKITRKHLIEYPRKTSDRIPAYSRTNV